MAFRPDRDALGAASPGVAQALGVGSALEGGKDFARERGSHRPRCTRWGRPNSLVTSRQFRNWCRAISKCNLRDTLLELAFDGMSILSKVAGPGLRKIRVSRTDKADVQGAKCQK